MAEPVSFDELIMPEYNIMPFPVTANNAPQSGDLALLWVRAHFPKGCAVVVYPAHIYAALSGLSSLFPGITPDTCRNAAFLVKTFSDPEAMVDFVKGLDFEWCEAVMFEDGDPCGDTIEQGE